MDQKYSTPIGVVAKTKKSEAFLVESLEKIAPILMAGMGDIGLLDKEKIFGILCKKVTFAKGEESDEGKNANQFIDLVKLQGEGASRINAIKAFLYFLIFQFLKEDNKPWAHYLLKCAYDIDDQRSNPRNYRGYEYARGLEMRSIVNFAPENYYAGLYDEIATTARADGDEAFRLRKPFDISIGAKLALVKRIIIGSTSLEKIVKSLTDLQVVYPALKECIEIERTWFVLCDYAKDFTSDNESIKELLIYIRHQVFLECPSVNETQKPEEDLVNISLEEQGKLKTLLIAADAARKSYAQMVTTQIIRGQSAEERILSLIFLVPPTDILSANKTERAFVILYNNAKPGNQDYDKKIESYKRCLRENNPHILYDFYQNYESFSSIVAFENFIEKHPKEFYLESAAFAGHVQAQYEISHYYLEKIKLLTAEDLATKGASAANPEILKYKARRGYFLTLAAHQNHADALFELSMAIEAGDIAGAIVGADFLYNARAENLGHQAAKVKYDNDMQRIHQMDIANISPDDLEFLYSRSVHNTYAAIRHALCLETGPEQFRDQARAVAIYQELVTKLRLMDLTDKGVVTILFVATLRLAVFAFESPKKDPRPTIAMLQDDLLSQEVESSLESEGFGVKEKLQLAVLIISSFKVLSKSDKAKLKSLIDSATKMAEAAIERLALRGFVKAQIFLASSKQEKDNFDDKKLALELFFEVANKAEYLSQEETAAMVNGIKSLVSNPNILPQNLNVLQIREFCEFVTDGKARFNLYKRIKESIAIKDLEEERQDLNNLAIEILALSAGPSDSSPDIYAPALSRLSDYFLDKNYNPNFEGISKFQKLSKSEKTTKAFAIAQRIYEIGNLAAEEERSLYQAEFSHYIKFLSQEKKVELMAQCGAWMEEPVVTKSAKQKAHSAVAKEKKPDIEELDQSAAAASAEPATQVLSKQQKPKILSKREKEALKQKREHEKAEEKIKLAQLAKEIRQLELQRIAQIKAEADAKAADEAAKLAEARARLQEQELQIAAAKALEESQILAKHEEAQAQARARAEEANRLRLLQEEQARIEQEKAEQEQARIAEEAKQLELAKQKAEQVREAALAETINPIIKFFQQANLKVGVSEIVLKGSALYKHYVAKKINPQDIDIEITSENFLLTRDMAAVYDAILKLFPLVKRTQISDLKIWRGLGVHAQDTSMLIQNIEFTLASEITRLPLPLNIVIRDKSFPNPPEKDWVASFDALRMILYKQGSIALQDKPQLSLCANFSGEVSDVVDKIGGEKVVLNGNNVHIGKIEKYSRAGLISAEVSDRRFSVSSASSSVSSPPSIIGSSPPQGALMPQTRQPAAPSNARPQGALMPQTRQPAAPSNASAAAAFDGRGADASCANKG